MKNFDPLDSFYKMTGAAMALTAAMAFALVCIFSMIALCKLLWEWIL